MKKILFAFLILSGIVSNSFSQDTISPKYMPLKVGNAWYYKTTNIIPFPPIFSKNFIEKDTIINGITYFKFNQEMYRSRFFRIDSTNGNFLAYHPGDGCNSYPNDRVVDSLRSSPDNVVTCLISPLYTRRCISVTNSEVFGNQVPTISYIHDGLIYGVVTYAYGFGVTYSCSGEPPPCSGFTQLMGCKIDGVVYGDTTFTSVSQISSAIPERYSLSQNYPNPFNPSTTIKFSIQSPEFVSVTIYDGSGKYVKSLVNEYKQPGTYEAYFDGTSLSSGVYYYKLSSERFTETMRMVLLK